MEWQVKTNLKFDKAVNDVENSMSLALRFMLDGIHQKAEPRTPLKDYGLRPSVSKRVLAPDRAVISWNIEYAGAQEEGGRTDPRTGKYIVFKNYTTPGTGAHFVEKSVNEVMNNIPYYLQLGGLM